MARLVRRSLLLLLILATLAATAWWWGRERAVAWMTRRAEVSLATTLGMPVRLRDVDLRLLPPGVEVAGAAFGADGSAAHWRDLSVRLDVAESLRRARPTLVVALSELSLDVEPFVALIGAEGEGSSSTPLPALALSLSVKGASVRLADGQSVELEELLAEVSAGSVRGLSLEARADGLAVLSATGRVAVDKMDLAARWRDGVWSVERGALHAPALDISVVGSGDPPRHRIEVRGDLRALSELLPPPQRVAGALSARFDLVGDLAEPRGEGHLRIEDAEVAGVALRRVEGTAERSQGRISVPSLRIDAGEGSVTMAGEMGEEARGEVRATLTLRDFDLEVLQPLLGEVDKAAARLDGEVVVEGTLWPLSGKARGRGTVQPRAGERAQWTAELGAAGVSKTLQLDIAQTGGSDVAARLALAEGGVLSGSVRAKLSNLAALGELLADSVSPAILPSAGSALIDLNVAGSLEHPLVEADVEGRDLILYGAPITALKASLRADERALALRSARLRLPTGSIEASGTFALAADATNDWQAKGSGVDAGWILSLLAELDVLPSIPLRGAASVLSVQAKGIWDEVAVAGQGQVEDGSIAGERFRHLRVDFATTANTWKVHAGMDGRKAGHLELRIGDSGVDGVEVSLAGEGWDLGELRVVDGEDLAGRIALRADFAGPPGALSGSGTLRIDEIVAAGKALGDLDVRAVAKRGAWILDGEALASALRLHATIDAGAALPMRLDATWEQLDVARLLGAEEDVSAPLTGSLSAQGSLRDPQAITAQMQMTSAVLSHGGESLSASSPIELRLARGEVAIQPFEVVGKDTRIRASGEISPRRALRLSLAGESSLGWLEAVLGPPLESADGELRFDLAVEKSPDEAIGLSGEILVSQGALDFGSVVALSNIEGSIALRDDIFEVQALTADMGGGAVSVQGVVGFSAGPDLEWRLRDVAIEPTRSLEVELRGSGSLRGPWDAVVLAGDVSIVQMLYDRAVEFADLIPSFNRALSPAPRGDGGLPPLRLDLRVKARDSLYVENNLARLEGKADLRVGGTLRAPRLRGEVSIVDGVIHLRGRQFDVLNGSLSFRPELRNAAAIDFKAESVIDTPEDSYGVSVRVSGFTNDYRVTLGSSDGSLSPTDVAALVAFGKTVSQLRSGGGGGGFSLDSLVGLTGNQLGSRLAGEAEAVLPFDQIELRPQFSTTTGQFETEIRAGKSLSDDLSAWIGQTFGVQSRTTVEGEYQLSAGSAVALSWESGTSSEQGALGGEIRFRRDFWRLGQILLFGRAD